ncbi:MAG: hypothetical protein R3A52_17770 [Polyangiales bacterium]
MRYCSPEAMMHEEQTPLSADPGDTASVGGAAVGPHRLRVRSLKVHEFRDVRRGSELTFSDGVHLALGQNGSGKSTLVELIAAVAAIDFGGPFFTATPFHIEARLELGPITLHVDARREFEPVRLRSVGEKYVDLPPRDEADVLVKVEVPGVLQQWLRARSGEALVRYDFDPREDHRPGEPIRLLGGVNPLRLTTSHAISHGATIPHDGGLRVHPAVWDAWRRVSEQPGTAAPYDEALGALSSLVGGGLTVVRGDSARVGSPWLPPSLDFDSKNGEPVEVDLGRDPLLASAIRQLGFDSARAYFGPGAHWSVGWRYAAPTVQFFHDGRGVRRHDQLSFGQQRLFSFAWYLACNPDIAVADELVNGLHADWIDWCVDAIGDRQCFLTAQSPLLVDAVRFDSEDQLRKGIIVCEARRADSGAGTEISLRQLDDREAALLTSAYRQSRLDLLSDLLRALDLW